MQTSERLALGCCVLFFLVGLLAGIWKFVGIMVS